MNSRGLGLSLTLLSVLVFTATYAIAGPNDYVIMDEKPCYSLEEEECSEFTVIGHSKGNHELDCTVIQPWDENSVPIQNLPVIVWANGWGWNDNAGETTTLGYKPGLIDWAFSGPYIVVAANQWSVQESDILQCLQWVIDEYFDEFEVSVDASKIGLSGHSQGGGAVIKAGDGGGSKINITATIPMNPYGPSWVRPGNQDGPMLLLGGLLDTTTPPDSYEAVWEAIVENGIGGIKANLILGSHNSEAWGVDADGNTLPWYEAQNINFGQYQYITEQWWDCHLNESPNPNCDNFLYEFDAGTWEAEETDGYGNISSN